MGVGGRAGYALRLRQHGRRADARDAAQGLLACSDTEHPDWDEYDQAMIDQEAVIVLIAPKRVYGLLRG